MCDTGKTFAGMSNSHLVTRARKHLNLNNNRTGAIKNHLQQYEFCSKTEINLDSSFTVLKKCLSEYDAKIHEALVIKQNKPLLHKQLKANRCSYLLKIFVYLCYSITIY